MLDFSCKLCHGWGEWQEAWVHFEGFEDVSDILGCGVYVLVRKGVVVYVGRSRKMLARIVAHQQVWVAKRGKGEKPWWLPVPGLLFDEVHVMRCRPDLLDQLAEAAIERYQPKYNLRVERTLPAPLRIRGRTFIPQPPAVEPIRRI